MTNHPNRSRGNFIAYYGGRHFLCVHTHGLGPEPAPTVTPKPITLVDGVWHAARGAVPWVSKLPIRETRYVACGQSYQPWDLAAL